MLARMQVEHEIGECSLQSRSQIPIHSETRACEFYRALHIKYAELLAELPMRFRREIELWRSAPTANFYIIFRAFAWRDGIAWQVGDSRHDLLQPLLKFPGGFFTILNL